MIPIALNSLDGFSLWHSRTGWGLELGFGLLIFRVCSLFILIVLFAPSRAGH